MLQQRPYTFAQTDMSLSFFRLQHGGGPYIPIGRQSTKNQQTKLFGSVESMTHRC